MDGGSTEIPMTEQVVSVTPSYRRNGKLFSCEPCRRGKLRCDHVSPVCGRCSKRGKPGQCIYHPAPLTKPRASPAIGPHRTANTSSFSTAGTNHAEPYPVIAPGRHHLVSPPSSARSLQQTQLGSAPFGAPRGSASSYASQETPFRDYRTRFLGPTSYSAVYTENPSILHTLGVEEQPNLEAIPGEKLQQGAEILSMLRDIPTYRKFTSRWFELTDGIIVMQPVIRIWFDDLWTEFGSILEEGRPEKLLGLSELVWQNTRQPMSMHGSMTAREWARSATGRNLRWEVVGALLSLIGLVAVSLSHWDSIFGTIRERYVDRATFSERMRKASEYCLCFCYESEVLNDIYVCFMFEDLILVESLKGDAHWAAWQRTGEVCDAVIAMGLHQGNHPDANTPFWLTELRKRILVSAYGHDKVAATFLGRPPRLSHRYCKMDMPLDLSDDQLFSEGEELEAALAGLDSNGWNTSSQLCRTTWLRIWLEHCRIREDILEIALGSDEQDVIFQSERVRQRMDRQFSTVPSCIMKLTPEDMFAAENFGGRSVNAIFLLHMHAGILLTEFLLQRAMVSRLRTDTAQLIPTSKRLLKLVLLAQSNRELFTDFQADLSSLLALAGLPAAGVLAVEMLKQEQTKQYTPDTLPRSETIQDLSVFISALGAIGPGEGNFSICDQGRRALSRALDQILSPPPPPPPPPSVTATGETLNYHHDASLHFPIANDADFLQWLEHVEWDKNQWFVDPSNSSMLG